jgi:hypothetical protein
VAQVPHHVARQRRLMAGLFAATAVLAVPLLAGAGWLLLR